MPSMSTFLCKNGVRKEYFLTPTFIIEPKKATRDADGFFDEVQSMMYLPINSMVRMYMRALILSV